MGSILKMARGSSAPPSANREKLSQRIEELKNLREELRDIEHALNDGNVSYAVIHAAQARIDAAEQRVKDVKLAQADYLVAISTGKAGTTAPDLKGARAELEDAHDHIQAIRDARKVLEDRVDPARRRVSCAETFLEDAIREVVTEESGGAIGAAIAELEDLHKKIIEKHFALTLLGSISRVPGRGLAVAWPVLEEMLTRSQTPMSQWRLAHVQEPSPARSAWDAAIKSLATDAYARLPERI